MKRLFTIFLILCFSFEIGFAGIEPPAQENLSIAFEKVIQGKELYYQSSFEEALNHFKEAQTLYHGHMASLTKGDSLFEAHIYAGLCHFSQKQMTSAKEEIKKAYLLKPKKTLDPKTFSPAFIAFFQETTKPLKDLSKTKLEIHSTPDFAKVYINGFEMGLTPLIINHWPQAEYHVRIVMDDFREWTSSINTTQQKNYRVNATLIRLSDPTWLSKKTSSNDSISIETQRFLKAMESQNTSAWTTSFWFWSIAAIAAGGVTYAVLSSQQQKAVPKSSTPVSIVTAHLP